MKRLTCALALSGLISTGALAPTAGKQPQSIQPLLISAVLKAHSVPQRPDVLSAFTAEAVKLTSYDGGVEGEPPKFFERKVSVSAQGRAFKRHKADPLGLRERIDLFDGRLAYHAEFESGREAPEVSHVGDLPSGAVEFSVGTFGLLPVLRRLSDPATEAVYVGHRAGRQHEFKVVVNNDNWSVYSDERHMIRRLKIGNRTIEYADYRTVEGMLLPFIQRFSVGDRLVYELVFTRIELTPSFPAGYFTHDALSTEKAR